MTQEQFDKALDEIEARIDELAESLEADPDNRTTRQQLVLALQKHSDLTRFATR
jgi:hypothetical protein